MTSNRQTTGTDAQEEPTTGRQGVTELEAAVAASPLEAAPASQTDGQGTSFYNPALTGSGTIMPDGTYGAPLPDPNLAKREADPEVTTDLKVADAANTEDGSDKPTTPATARKRASQS
jgi:hypothetical protein